MSYSTEMYVEPQQPFDFYVVAHDVQVALMAWEARIVVDPRLLVIERDFEGLNVGREDEIITALKEDPSNTVDYERDDRRLRRDRPRSHPEVQFRPTHSRLPGLPPRVGPEDLRRL